MVARIPIEDKILFHIDILPKATQQALLYLRSSPILKGTRWYLAGGTALALHLGHRKSVDLDFFLSGQSFNEEALLRKLVSTKHWSLTHQEDGTIFGVLLNAKVSFIAYPFFQPSSKRAKFGNIRMLLPQDIGAMKIVAISQRGRKRDFLDLYWYIQKLEPLEDVIFRALRQYPGQEHNLPHILKSLVYF